LYITTTSYYINYNDIKEVNKFYNRVIIPYFNLRVLNINKKLVLSIENLRAILTFNITYNISIF
ncbi:hypothetical protein BDP67DRAFT_389272, partial [Colletotrichum lupini]